MEICEELIVDRRRTVRRAMAGKRVDSSEPMGAEQGEHQPVERRKVERRKQIDPTTCERDYSGDEIEFMKAMDNYKRRSGRQFPTWSEVLEVLKDMGYRKVAEPMTTFVPESEKAEA